MEWLQRLLNRIDLGRIEALSTEILAATVVLVATFWISRTLQKFLGRRLAQDGHSSEDTIRAYLRVASLLVWTPGVLIAVDALGPDLSRLFTTGGLFAVALALVLKTVSENLVAGLALRLEGSIKPGDILETDGMMVKVESIGFRATVARTGDEKNMLIPNVDLIQSRIANCTYRDPLFRIDTSVGVDYASDLRQVQDTLKRVCEELDWRSRHCEPSVYIIDFGDSAVNFSVRVWIDDAWRSLRQKSLLNEAVWRGLKEAGIVIAFPQLDVHLDEGSALIPDSEEM